MKKFYFTACVVFLTFALFPLLEKRARADDGVWVGCGGSMIGAEANYVVWDVHRVRFHGYVTLPNSGWMVTSVECFCTGNGINLHKTPETRTAMNGWTWETYFDELVNGDYDLAVKVTYMSTGWPMAIVPIWGHVPWVIDDVN